MSSYVSLNELGGSGQVREAFCSHAPTSGSSEGRTYVHDEKYTNAAVALPHILENLLNGYPGEQTFELHERGRRVGQMAVRAHEDGEFELRGSVSGGLPVSEMTPIFWKFMKIPNLATIFNLRDQRAKNCILEIFNRILRNKAGSVSLGDSSKVKLSFYYGRIVLEQVGKSHSSFSVVAKFFESFPTHHFHGIL